MYSNSYKYIKENETFKNLCDLICLSKPKVSYFFTLTCKNFTKIIKCITNFTFLNLS